MKNQREVVQVVDQIGLLFEEELFAHPGRLTGLSIAVIGVLLVASIFFLLLKMYFIVSIVAPAFAGVVTIGTWAYAQHRMQAQISWEAIKEYYGEGDDDHFVRARECIGIETVGQATIDLVQKDPSVRTAAVARVCNFWEKWGRLVEKGYLPLWIFDGPSGDGAANILRLVREDIKMKRSGAFGNPRYARSYVWLVKQIRTSGYLAHWVKANLEDLDKCLSELEIAQREKEIS